MCQVKGHVHEDRHQWPTLRAGSNDLAGLLRLLSVVDNPILPVSEGKMGNG